MPKHQCGSCEKTFDIPSVDATCPHCGSGNWVTGLIDQELVDQDEMKEYVNQITKRVISTSRSDAKLFCDTVVREAHRTEQQSLTRLCVEWLQYVGRDEYLTDGRNEASHQVGSQFRACVEDGTIDPFLPFV